MPQWEIDILKPDMSAKEIGKVCMPPITDVREKLGAYSIRINMPPAPGSTTTAGSPRHSVCEAKGVVSEQGNCRFLRSKTCGVIFGTTLPTGIPAIRNPKDKCGCDKTARK